MIDPPAQPVKAPDALRLSAELVLEISGGLFRERLLEHARGRGITVRACEDAAHDLVPWLGISESAWMEAIRAFGPLRAAICILAIEANLSHPTKPIHKPGGALRAFTRLERAGKFNFTGMVLGLRDRARKQKGHIDA